MYLDVLSKFLWKKSGQFERKIWLAHGASDRDDQVDPAPIDYNFWPMLVAVHTLRRGSLERVTTIPYNETSWVQTGGGWQVRHMQTRRFREEKKVTRTGISHTLSPTRLCVCRLMSKLARQVLGLWSRCQRTCRICAESRLILTGMHEKKFSQLAIFVTVAIFVTSLMKTMHLNWSM